MKICRAYRVFNANVGDKNIKLVVVTLKNTNKNPPSGLDGLTSACPPKPGSPPLLFSRHSCTRNERERENVEYSTGLKKIVSERAVVKVNLGGEGRGSFLSLADSDRQKINVSATSNSNLTELKRRRFDIKNNMHSDDTTTSRQVFSRARTFPSPPPGSLGTLEYVSKFFITRY